MMIWRMLLAHIIRFAASRTFCTAGSRRAMSKAMMAMTTKSSISVNARLALQRVFIERLPEKRQQSREWPRTPASVTEDCLLSGTVKNSSLNDSVSYSEFAVKQKLHQTRKIAALMTTRYDYPFLPNLANPASFS